MKRTNYLLSLAAILLTACTTGRQQAATDPADSWKALEQPLNFYIANDLGRNGYYEQKTVAATSSSWSQPATSITSKASRAPQTRSG